MEYNFLKACVIFLFSILYLINFAQKNYHFNRDSKPIAFQKIGQKMLSLNLVFSLCFSSSDQIKASLYDFFDHVYNRPYILFGMFFLLVYIYFIFVE